MLYCVSEEIAIRHVNRHVHVMELAYMYAPIHHTYGDGYVLKWLRTAAFGSFKLFCLIDVSAPSLHIESIDSPICRNGILS